MDRNNGEDWLVVVVVVVSVVYVTLDDSEAARIFQIRHVRSIDAEYNVSPATCRFVIEAA
jgi:hypothetical protein